VIGAEASIGDGCCIGSHVVVENGARIGAGTILHAHVFVGAGCEIGVDCEVHPHSTIGSDGWYGAVVNPKISHLGNVRIGDEVRSAQLRGRSCDATSTAFAPARTR
jgi:UDP-3-O-[3-hydroxymyristoyl] glucosamine N-acyltransferase